MSAIVIHGIGVLCTCDPLLGEAPGVVRDAALVARDGVIVYAGPEATLDRGDVPRGALEVHARGAAVIPGFVDAHTHIVWLGDRGDEYARRAAGATYEEIAAAGGGIRSTVAATAAGSVEDLVTAARERARSMLAGGTTTIEVKSGYGLEHDAEMRQLDAAERLRQWQDLPDVVATYLPLHATPDGPREPFIDDVCTRGVKDAAKRALFVDAFCDAGAYTVAECQRLFTAAKTHHLRPKIHAEQLSHSGGALLAAQVGAVSADHLEYATNTDLEALSKAGVVGVILPGASLVMGGPPAARSWTASSVPCLRRRCASGSARSCRSPARWACRAPVAPRPSGSRIEASCARASVATRPSSRPRAGSTWGITSAVTSWAV